jgi:hypothetical protein
MIRHGMTIDSRQKKNQFEETIALALTLACSTSAETLELPWDPMVEFSLFSTMTWTVFDV